MMRKETPYKPQYTALLVEASPTIESCVRHVLQQDNWNVVTTKTPTSTLEALEKAAELSEPQAPLFDALILGGHFNGYNLEGVIEISKALSIFSLGTVAVTYADGESSSGECRDVKQIRKEQVLELPNILEAMICRQSELGD